MRHVISLYDYTAEALKPWAEAGFDCFAYDIQHDPIKKVSVFEGGGSITYVQVDLHSESGLLEVYKAHRGLAFFGMAFPVCTDLAVSGAKHFKIKAEKDPNFQYAAAAHAISCADMFDCLGIPYFIENPVSVLSTLWRKPDHIFNPYEYGGYIPEDQGQHPEWPEYIAAFDAYPKKTCLWAGKGFIMPEPKPVLIDKGYSTQFKKLGGKSMKTKNIRSATPRGFARAVYEANSLTKGNELV